jgi:hypothetical protein
VNKTARQVCQDRTARNGLSGQGWQDRKAWTVLSGQDCYEKKQTHDRKERIAKKGHPEQDSQQDSQTLTGRTSQADRTGRTGQAK